MPRIVRYLVVAAAASAFLVACGGDDGVAGGDAPIGKIAFVAEQDGNSEIFVVNADGTGLTNLTDHPAQDGVRAPNEGVPFAWSPDGSQIAFVSTREGRKGIYVMNAEGSQLKRLTSTDTVSEAPTWSPDGSQIAYVSIIVDVEEHASAQRIFLMNADGSNQRRLTQWERTENYPAWSPDGSRIAFQAEQIYVVNADGTGLVDLTSAGEIGDDANERYDQPRWSSDGERIAADALREASDRHLYQQIFVMNNDGSNLRRVPPDANETDHYVSPVWSPSGEEIAFTHIGRDKYRIEVMRSDGSHGRQLTDLGISAGVRWSPDGSWVTFSGAVSTEDRETLGVYIKQVNGSRQMFLTELHVKELAWSPIP